MILKRLGGVLLVFSTIFEVRNLDPIHGISMNYVDASNVQLSILERIWEMQAAYELMIVGNCV